MADYWISQARKHCDFCDCWIADNKPSIDFHEKGKRHKENVEKKIAELRKKGQEQYKQQQELAGDLKKIEEEALKKFQQDVANDPALSAKYKALQAKTAAINAQKANVNKADSSKPQEDDLDATQTDQKLSEEDHQQLQPVWYEGTNADGRVYYWNSKTQESRWEKPADFDCVSVSSAPKEETDSTETSTHTKHDSNDSEEEENESKTENTEAESESEKLDDRTPDKRKANPAYGGWTMVEKEEPVDLELPTGQKVYQAYVPKAAQTQPRERLKFKTKTVTSLAGNSGADSTVGFKKRKFGGNVRKRDSNA